MTYLFLLHENETIKYIESPFQFLVGNVPLELGTGNTVKVVLTCHLRYREIMVF